MKNENWDVEAEAIKFIYTDEIEVEVDGVVMSLDSFLKSTNGKIYENKTLLEQAMETRPYNADDLPRVRIIADKGIVTMIDDEFEVTITISCIKNVTIERCSDVQCCTIETDAGNYIIGSWTTLFSSRDLFCGKFDIEYFGKFHGVAK